jgi:hypothetical protein
MGFKLMGDNINIIKKRTESLSFASKQIGVEANAEKSNYMSLSRPQNAGQTQNSTRVNISLKVSHAAAKFVEANMCRSTVGLKSRKCMKIDVINSAVRILIR